MRSLGLLINQGILRQCGITLINVYVLYYPYFISSSYTMALFNHHKDYLHYLFFYFHSLFISTFQVPSNIAQNMTSAYYHILFITFNFPRNYIIIKTMTESLKMEKAFDNYSIKMIVHQNCNDKLMAFSMSNCSFKLLIIVF